MTMRKPPCPPNCQDRKPACQGHCERYAPYAAQMEQDRIDRANRWKQESNWTASSVRRVKTMAEAKRRKERGDF